MRVQTQALLLIGMISASCAEYAYVRTEKIGGTCKYDGYKPGGGEPILTPITPTLAKTPTSALAKIVGVAGSKIPGIAGKGSALAMHGHKLLGLFSTAAKLGPALGVFGAAMGVFDALNKVSPAQIIGAVNTAITKLTKDMNDRLSKMKGYVDAKVLGLEKELVTKEYRQMFTLWSNCASETSIAKCDSCMLDAIRLINSAGPKFYKFSNVASFPVPPKGVKRTRNYLTNNPSTAPPYYEVKRLEISVLGFRDYVTLRLMALDVMLQTYKEEMYKKIGSSTCYDHSPDCGAPSWKEEKYCTDEKFADWMMLNCQRTCGYCPDQEKEEGGHGPPSPGIEQGILNKEAAKDYKLYLQRLRDAAKEAVDYAEWMTEWIKIRNCEENKYHDFGKSCGSANKIWEGAFGNSWTASITTCKGKLQSMVEPTDCERKYVTRQDGSKPSSYTRTYVSYWGDDKQEIAKEVGVEAFNKLGKEYVDPLCRDVKNFVEGELSNSTKTWQLIYEKASNEYNEIDCASLVQSTCDNDPDCTWDDPTCKKKQKDPITSQPNPSPSSPSSPQGTSYKLIGKKMCSISSFITYKPGTKCKLPFTGTFQECQDKCTSNEVSHAECDKRDCAFVMYASKDKTCHLADATCRLTDGKLDVYQRLASDTEQATDDYGDYSPEFPDRLRIAKETMERLDEEQRQRDAEASNTYNGNDKEENAENESTKMAEAGIKECKDLNKDCVGWKAQGRCTGQYADFMNINCQSSCGQCPDGSVKPEAECKNLNKDCDGWRQQGRCTDEYAASMKIHCQLACGLCKASDTVQDTRLAKETMARLDEETKDKKPCTEGLCLFGLDEEKKDKKPCDTGLCLFGADAEKKSDDKDHIPAKDIETKDKKPCTEGLCLFGLDEENKDKKPCTEGLCLFGLDEEKKDKKPCDTGLCLFGADAEKKSDDKDHIPAKDIETKDKKPCTEGLCLFGLDEEKKDKKPCTEGLCLFGLDEEKKDKKPCDTGLCLFGADAEKKSDDKDHIPAKDIEAKKKIKRELALMKRDKTKLERDLKLDLERADELRAHIKHLQKNQEEDEEALLVG